MAEDREPESTDESTPAAGDQSDLPDTSVTSDPVAATSEDTADVVEPGQVDQPGEPESEAQLESDDAAESAESGDDGTAGTAGAPDAETTEGTGGTDDAQPALVGAAAQQSVQTKDLKKSDKKSKTDTNDTAGTASTKTAARTAAKDASGSKGRATPKQRRAIERERRTGPVRFASESVGELRKVVYPTASQLRTYFVVVLVFVLFVISFVSLLDLGFGWVILRVFG